MDEDIDYAVHVIEPRLEINNFTKVEPMIFN